MSDAGEAKPSILIISHRSDLSIEVELKGFLTESHGHPVVSWNHYKVNRKDENLNTQFQTQVNAADVVVVMLSHDYKNWQDATFVTEVGQEHTPIDGVALLQQLIDQRPNSVYLVHAGDCYFAENGKFLGQTLYPPRSQGIGSLLNKTPALKKLAQEIVQFATSLPAEKPNFTLDVSPSLQSLSADFNAAAPAVKSSKQPKISRSGLSL